VFSKKITDFIRGWFIGNFKPTVYKTNDVEVAYKIYKAGDKEKKHYHKIATEFSVVVKGIIEMNGRKYYKGDIIVMEPGDVADFSVIEDAENVVVKIPGANNDKYEVD
jgi:quercetin dioxygenase-like cupin family protein